MEQNKIPARPIQTPTSNGIWSARAATVPVPLICAVTYVKEATTRIITAQTLGRLPPYLVPMKSGTV